MGLLDKVKNFFYEEEEVDEYEETMPIKIHHKEKKEKKVKVVEDVPREKIKEEKQDISERELFKAERTFNFPMDIYDDDINGITEEELEKTIVEKEKISKPEHNTYTPKQENPYSNIRSYAKTEEKKEEKESKKFRPTPVISPIYGILDKNYTKEDVIIDSASDDKETKKIDYDTVRRKAYKDVYKTEEEDKGIFFNLDEEKKDNTDDEVKIVYNDVTLDEEEDYENVTIGQKIEEYQKELEKDIDVDDYDQEDINEDKEILSETKEQDLFNLIDNMYNSDDDDDDEEE